MMARRSARPEATHEVTLTPLKERCEQCGQFFWVAHHGHRTVAMLSGLWRMTLVVRQCIQPSCPRFHQPYRPEEEGRLPVATWRIWRCRVIVLIGQWRFREHRSVPEMHQALQARGISIAQRSVGYGNDSSIFGPFAPLIHYLHLKWITLSLLQIVLNWEPAFYLMLDDLPCLYYPIAAS